MKPGTYQAYFPVIPIISAQPAGEVYTPSIAPWARAVLISDGDGPAPLSAGLTDDAEPDHRIGRLREIVAIVDDRRLYLKVDAESAARFAAAGGQPFSYERSGKTAQLAFWTVPDEAMDSAVLMQPWGRLALQAAVRARTAAVPRPRRQPRGRA